MIEAVHRYEGYVVQSTGDGIFALFGAPVAHEDHPQRALHAALATRDELHRHGEDLRSRGRPAVEVRIGINTGEVVMRTVHTGGHTEYAPVGQVINLAARMQSAAPAGGIVISEDTQRLVEGYFELRELGPTEVKGIEEPISIYEVIGAGPLHGHFELAVRRGLTRFVGRERELSQMAHALELACGGHGQIVAVVAEAGTGKSRLFYEFKATLEGDAKRVSLAGRDACPTNCKVLEAYSVSHGKASAWLPVLELLRGYFGIQEGDDPVARREKVGATLAALDPALSDIESYLFALLAITESPDPLAEVDPQVRRKSTLEAIKRIVLRESLKQPVVIIFEDLHWIDGETQALLDLLADSIAGGRLLLLVNYRPEYRHEWSGRSNYLQVRLDPLGVENAGAMLAALLGGGAELDALRRLITERTGGNPFFIEEMVQALFEQGILAHNGAVKLVRPLAEAHLPVTVQGVLAARIDRLPAQDKDLLQTLAVAGNEFRFALAKRVTQMPDEVLQNGLATLRLGEFIYEQPQLTDIEYSFKHALTHEVAYNSLLIERRKLLHERAGEALESLFGEQLDDHLSELAHHYSHSANIGKAVHYLYLAARQCAVRTADFQALAYLDRGLELLQSLPESPERYLHELVVQIARGQSLQATQGFAAPETGRTFGRARELCERFGDPAQLFSVLYGLFLFSRWRLELQTARQVAEQLVSTAKELNDPAKLVRAHGTLGASLLWLGELGNAREHLEWAKDTTGPAGDDPFQTASSLVLLAWNLAVLGYLDQAMRVRQQVLDWVQGLSMPFTLATTLQLTCVFDQLRRDDPAALEHSGSLLQIGADYGFPGPTSIATVIHGWARSCHGEVESGIAEMCRGIADNEANGARSPSFLLVPLADTYVRIGRTEEASHLLADTLERAHQTGDRMQEAELYRLKAELAVKASRDGAEAEICFRRAIKIARGQSAKWWELRATTSLARLLASQGQANEARTMLSAIYGWFTEGFDTADLKEAKALLDEWSAS
jgi:predicted ATPase